MNERSVRRLKQQYHLLDKAYGRIAATPTRHVDVPWPLARVVLAEDCDAAYRNLGLIGKYVKEAYKGAVEQALDDVYNRLEQEHRERAEASV